MCNYKNIGIYKMCILHTKTYRISALHYALMWKWYVQFFLTPVRYESLHFMTTNVNLMHAFSLGLNLYWDKNTWIDQKVED